MTGRPSDFTDEIAIAICEELAAGKSLREICKAEGMPDRSTVFRWLAKYDSFRDQYARAREVQAELYADEIVDISDDGTNDWMQRQNGDNPPILVPNHEHISRSKLRVDSRKWLLSKLLPKKYGDKVTQEVTGADGGPIAHSIAVKFVKPDGNDS